MFIDNLRLEREKNDDLIKVAENDGNLENPANDLALSV